MLTGRVTIKKVQDPLFVFFVLFACTYFIYYDFGLSAFISLGICLVLVCAGFIHQLSRGKRGELLKVDSLRFSFLWIAIVMLFNFLRFDSEQNNANIYYIGIILVCALILLFSNPGQNGAEKTIKYLLVAALAVAMFTIFFSLFENIYQTTIYPLLGEKRKEYADLTSTHGYGVSLGGVTYTAYIMIMGIAVINGNVISHSKQSGKAYIWQLLLSGIILVALVVLGRKGELVSMVLAFVSIWAMNGLLKKGKVKKSSFIVVSVVLIVLVLALQYLVPVLFNAGLMDRYISFFNNYSSGQDVTSGRVQLWKWGWELFCQHPIFGAGLDSYSKYIPESARITGSGTQILSPHIVYLHILCEYGIVGFFLLIIPMGYILIKTLRQYTRLTKLRATNKNPKMINGIIRINATSLFIQVFFAFLFFFDQTFSLVQFWLFYCVAVYLSSASSYSCVRNGFDLQ